MQTQNKPSSWDVFKREIALLNSIPLLWVSFFVISLVPAFYAVTYLGSLWDPYGKLGNLPVALVNLDSGTEFKGKHYALGERLLDELEEQQTFGFMSFDERQQAEDAVNAGYVYFALIIPSDFSAKAIPGQDTAKLELITSSGTSYTASLFAQKFTDVVVEKLNHRLELERWEVVLGSGATALNAAKQLESGSQKALQGSKELSQAILKINSAVAELTTGQTGLADGLSGIDTKKLVSTGETLHAGTQKLAAGLASHKMIDKLVGIKPDKLEQLASGAAQYQSKIEELASGLEKAAKGADSLQQGGNKLSEALSRLQSGSDSLEAGLVKLHAGLQEFAAAFPQDQQNAETLSVSVSSSHTSLNTAATNGLGFAPFLMAFALWIGAMSASFVFLMTTFSDRLKNSGSTAKVLGKEAAPALINVTGAIVLGLAIQSMGVPLASVSGYFAILILAALTYNAITLLLIRFLGDSGKLAALLLLVIQLASASGAYPIELSSAFYQNLSPYLPMTSVVDGLRAAMFGSYAGNWEWYALKLLPWLIACLLLSHLAVKRSSYVADDDYGPALKLAFGKSK